MHNLKTRRLKNLNLSLSLRYYFLASACSQTNMHTSTLSTLALLAATSLAIDLNGVTSSLVGAFTSQATSNPLVSLLYPSRVFWYKQRSNHSPSGLRDVVLRRLRKYKIGLRGRNPIPRDRPLQQPSARRTIFLLQVPRNCDRERPPTIVLLETPLERAHRARRLRFRRQLGCESGPYSHAYNPRILERK